MEDESLARRRSGSLIQGLGSQNHMRNGQGQATGEGSDRSWPSSSDVEMDDMRSDDGLDDDEETGLTQGDRKKRRRRKRKSRQLDERVAVERGSITSVERKLVTASMLKNSLGNALLIGLWYSFSISISVYNKWMFSKDNLDFHFPLFTTSLHMLVQFMLASAVLFFIPRFRPPTDSSNPHDPSYAQVDGAEQEDSTSKPPSKPLMSKWFYLTRIGPCGTATALDIGLGNFSLRFISLTFYTMCKSSVLAFVLVFAFIFHLEKPTWRLCVIILFMTAGVVMMVAGEAAFNALGFILVMSASFCSGFRWSLTQILLLRNPATSNPFSSIFFLTPVMFLALFVLALPIEGPANVIAGIHVLSENSGTFLSIIILLFPGCLAFLMVAAEFALLKRTSVVTLSVCGIFKEVLTISAAGIVFGDPLSPINVSGLCVTIASIAAYNYVKYTNMKKDAEKEVHEVLEAEEDERDEPSSVAYEQGDKRREESSALMRDSLHLATDLNIDDAAHDRVANGALGSSRKPPEALE